MRTIICEDYNDMSYQAAKIMISQLTLKPNSILGLATGSTPIGLYDNLVEAYEAGEIDFSAVTTFNLDEYYPISEDNPQSYRYFMNKHLFSRVNIDMARTNVPFGEAKDPDKECEEYEKKLAAAGRVDLQVLGIGKNGHIGFNEPSDELSSVTHLTDLTASTIDANARFFDNKDDVPKKALTMGIGTIMKSGKIILLASGVSKHRAVKALMDKSINTDIPATILKAHPDVILICDREAFFGRSENTEKIRIGIDLGGTNIAAGIVDIDGNIVAKDSVPTKKGASCREIASDMAGLVKSLVEKNGHTVKDILSVGIGCPGFVNRESGVVILASNLGFENAPLADEFKKHINVPVSLENDADAAALGEYNTVGENCESFVFMTLGTGVGSGIVIDGQIYRGSFGEGAELGHITLKMGGEKCNCGRNGCYERYASAAALVRQSKAAAEAHPESMLALEKEITGKSAFDLERKGDKTSHEVVEQYISYVAEGIMDVMMLLRPKKIVIGGGISNEGEPFVARIRDYIANNMDSEELHKTEISVAKLRGDAGIIGSALAADEY